MQVDNFATTSANWVSSPGLSKEGLFFLQICSLVVLKIRLNKMPHKRDFPLRNAYINLWLLRMQEILPKKDETIQGDINWKGLFDLPAKIFFF